MLYGAYGSNLNLKQMKGRCPSSNFLGMGKLIDYRLSFNGELNNSYLTVVKSKGSVVPIGIFEIDTQYDWDRLDKYEGVSNGLYRRETLNVITDNGEIKEVVVYIMDESIPESLPSSTYYNTVVQGYIDVGVPELLYNVTMAYSNAYNELMSSFLKK